MFDFKNLVGMMMESGVSRSGMGRMKHALGDQGLGGQNGLLGGLMGGSQGSGGLLSALTGGGQSGGIRELGKDPRDPCPTSDPGCSLLPVVCG